MRVLTVASHKGGTGKTTLVANLAPLLAAHEPVLCIDLDPQGGLTAALGVEPSKPTVYEVLHGQASIDEAARPVADGTVRLVPADLDLAAAQVELPSTAGWHDRLEAVLAPVENAAGLVLVDTPPGLGVLVHLALAASDAVVGVCPPEFLALRALPMLLETVEQARAGCPQLRLVGLVPTLAGTRTCHERDALRLLGQWYPNLLLPAVPRRVAVQDAQVAGMPVVDYQADSAASVAFRQIAQEVRRRVQAPQPV